MRLMLLVHLLLAYNDAAPVRELMLHMYKKPSLEKPRLARYSESGEKAKHLTPKVWSESDVRGVSGAASRAVEKIKTRGL